MSNPEKKINLNTTYTHEVKLWPNKMGLEWDMEKFPDGSFCKIQWPAYAHPNNKAGNFSVTTSRNDGVHIEREASLEEIYNFALLTIQQMPNGTLTNDMIVNAAEALHQDAERKINESNALLDLLVSVQEN